MTECYYCKKPAEVEGGGVAYYREKVNGLWDNIPICLSCLKDKEPRFR